MAKFGIRPASPGEQSAALELLFQRDDDPGERAVATLNAQQDGDISLDGLLVAEDGRQLVGAGLFTMQPGRIGFVWPPSSLSEHPQAVAIRRALLKEVGRRLDRAELCLGQVILETGDEALREDLNATGFAHLTDLHYLIDPIDAPFPKNAPRFDFETYDENSNRVRFIEALRQSYIGTLDCPELDGLRTADEALIAHQATGVFDPKRWLLAQDGGDDAGLILVNAHPEQELLEIVYLGVVPSFRGRGWGRRLVEWTQHLARSEHQSLVLAVDGRNHLARRIYQKLGFVELSIQAVHIRPGRPLAKRG